MNPLKLGKSSAVNLSGFSAFKNDYFLIMII